jgi:hypothetical protein
MTENVIFIEGKLCFTPELEHYFLYKNSIIYPMQYIKKIAELDCCQIIILSTYVPSTHAYTHVLRVSLDLPYEKR